MTIGAPKIRSLGDAGILLQWDDAPSEHLLQKILSLKNGLKNHFNCEALHTYNELLIKKSPYSISESELQELINTIIVAAVIARTLFTIPVCYDVCFGEDIETLAHSKNLSTTQIINLHTAPEYLIYFIGFLPGFLYLNGLNEQLITPRKASPKLNVPSGSVAIGGSQTGVYPQESPGGWHIIGRTPLLFFDVKQEEPSPFKAGDKLRFKSVSIAEYGDIQERVETGNYNFETIAL